jgi:hypothetical protein
VQACDTRCRAMFISFLREIPPPHPRCAVLRQPLDIQRAPLPPGTHNRCLRTCGPAALEPWASPCWRHASKPCPRLPGCCVKNLWPREPGLEPAGRLLHLFGLGRKSAGLAHCTCLPLFPLLRLLVPSTAAHSPAGLLHAAPCWRRGLPWAARQRLAQAAGLALRLQQGQDVACGGAKETTGAAAV